MDFDVYQQEAARTAPRSPDAYPEAVRLSASPRLLEIHDTLIWALGLAGEAGELLDACEQGTRSEVVKESGDLAWYIANLARVHGFKLTGLYVPECTLSLTIAVGQVCDLLKKVHGHGKPYEPETMRRALGQALAALLALALRHGITFSEFAPANVAKLRARYPEGFSVAAAQAKVDEKMSRCPPEEPITQWPPDSAIIARRNDVPPLVERIEFKPRDPACGAR